MGSARVMMMIGYIEGMGDVSMTCKHKGAPGRSVCRPVRLAGSNRIHTFLMHTKFAAQGRTFPNGSRLASGEAYQNDAKHCSEAQKEDTGVKTAGSPPANKKKSEKVCLTF